MTITLDLPSAMSARLEEEAARLEEPLEEYLKMLIAQAMPKPRNGAELVALLEEDGVIGMWADRPDIGDNVEYARSLRQAAETRSGE